MAVEGASHGGKHRAGHPAAGDWVVPPSPYAARILRRRIAATPPQPIIRVAITSPSPWELFQNRPFVAPHGPKPGAPWR